MFHQLLHEESICLGLEAQDANSALREMVQKLPFWNEALSTGRGEILRRLLEREKFGTTAIGDGICLPHCSFSGIDFPVAVLGISRRGIPFASLDGEPVRFILMLIVPESGDFYRTQQQILHSAEALLRDRFLQERLNAADSPADVYEILLRESSNWEEREASRVAAAHA